MLKVYVEATKINITTYFVGTAVVRSATEGCFVSTHLVEIGTFVEESSFIEAKYGVGFVKGM